MASVMAWGAGAAVAAFLVRRYPLPPLPPSLQPHICKRTLQLYANEPATNTRRNAGTGRTRGL